eukprot:15365953-Ditylum_brightwellii.AAC.1
MQLVETKKPLIVLEVEEGEDITMGESRTYKLCMQLENGNSPVYSLTVELKQVLKGQNMGDMDMVYTLVWDLLRDNALTLFSNEQATLKEQTLDNLEHCLNTMTDQVLPNKMVDKLNNYLTEFPTPAGVEARKQAQLVRATPKQRGSTRPNAKQTKRLTAKGGKLLHDVIEKVEDVNIASTMGIATTPQMSVTSPSVGSKDACTMNRRKDPARARRYASTVARPSLVSPCWMEART